MSTSQQSQTATLGGGCFWCLEAIYQRVPGVIQVVSGYAAGHDPAPTYEAVCSGATGHAEVVQVTFEAGQITYEGILDWFWKMHDPTTLNRQGYDIGTQYRSIILTHNDEQQRQACASRDRAAALFTDPIVTEIEPLGIFHAAESYHQNYFRSHPQQPYCARIIAPKVSKLTAGL